MGETSGWPLPTSWHCRSTISTTTAASTQSSVPTNRTSTTSRTRRSGSVKNYAPKDQPFYLQVSTTEPHRPYFYPKRYADKYASEEAPKPLRFNEADVSDKPSYVRNRPLLSDAKIRLLDKNYRKRLRGLRGSTT
jgi:hypothetical protein